MMWKRYYTPKSLSEALELKEGYGKRARIIAGGTDLVIDLSKKGVLSPEAVIDISSISDIRNISLQNGELYIGSAVTFSEILRSSVIRANVPILVEAVRQIAGPQIRNLATIGGNVVNASPAADSIPPLLVLDTIVSITGPGGISREVYLEQLLLGNRKVALETNEIVTGFHFQVPPKNYLQYFRKVKPRQSMAIALLNLAIFLSVENARIFDVRIAMGAVAPTAVRIKTVENELKNLPTNLAKDPNRYKGVFRDINPITDFRGSRQYRLRVAKNLLYEAIVELLERSDQNGGNSNET